MSEICLRCGRDVASRSELYPINDFQTTPMFWDCECEHDFIQPRHINVCPKCGAKQEDLPDSRINEVRDVLKKEYPTELDDDLVDRLLATTTKPPRDFEELAKELGLDEEKKPPSEYECPFCKKREICKECGESVALGSGKFVDRIPDCNSEEERKEMGAPFPEGDFLCIACKENYLKENSKMCQVCDNYETSVDKWEGFEAICQVCKSDMEDAIKNIQHEEWLCWTLSTDDITGIAKRKGISLAGKDIDDIARRVKKGIQWSLDEQWESIVADSIYDSKAE